MDYISAFQSLKTNNKYARKSPHKAVLLLAVIDMFESKVLSKNEIRYDDSLLKTFQKVWNRVLPHETTFFTNVYFPFWYMQSEEFWFNVPVRGKEDAFRELWDSRVKPTENRVKELIQYAVLDSDLYFMMTMPSGCASLKRALLEEYTELSEREIDRMCVVKEMELEDKATIAMREYQAILNTEPTAPQENTTVNNAAGESCLLTLSDNLQIALNFEYYSFLKSHRVERDLFREIFPSVDELVRRIMKEPYKLGDLNYSFSTIYENFLGDLRVALMSEDDSMSFIDNISSAIALLQGVNATVETPIPEEPIGDNKGTVIPTVGIQPQEPAVSRFEVLLKQFSQSEPRNGRRWSDEEKEFAGLCLEKGWNCKRIGDLIGRTAFAVYIQLTNMGHTIDEDPDKLKELSAPPTTPMDYRVVNRDEMCYIYNKNNECVFSTNGSLKVLHGKPYRFNYKKGFFTVKAIERVGNRWSKSGKLLVAAGTSNLYRYIESHDCSLEDIEDFIERPCMYDNRIKFSGIWYDFYGNRVK